MNKGRFVNALVDDRWIGSHGIGRFAKEVISRIGPYVPVRKNISLLSIWEPYQLSREISNTKASVYFSPGYNPPLTSDIPVVFTIHDLIHLKFSGENGILKRIYYEMIVKPAILKSFKVLTVSHFSKYEIMSWAGVGSEKVVVVGNGVDQQYTPVGDIYSPGYPYFLNVGNHKPHKNIKRIIKAFIGSSIPSQVRLILTGTPDKNLREVIKKYRAEERVVFCTHIEEKLLPAYYRGAIGLLFPSLYEGFGLPIVEAMACGTPVITSNITSMPEVAGEAALLVDPHDCDDIRMAIERVFWDKDLCESLVVKGMRRAKDFSWEETASQVMMVLRMAIQ